MGREIHKATFCKNTFRSKLQLQRDQHVSKACHLHTMYQACSTWKSLIHECIASFPRMDKGNFQTFWILQGETAWSHFRDWIEVGSKILDKTYGFALYTATIQALDTDHFAL